LPVAFSQLSATSFLTMKKKDAGILWAADAAEAREQILFAVAEFAIHQHQGLRARASVVCEKTGAPGGTHAATNQVMTQHSALGQAITPSESGAKALVLVNGKLGDAKRICSRASAASAAQRMPASFFFKSRMMSPKAAEGDGQIVSTNCRAD